MIPRFSRPEMTAIWSPENKAKIWLEVELLACEGQESIGAIPPGTTDKIRAKAGFDLARIDEIEKEVRHDVIAFLTNVGETVGDDARYIHMGMTSSDMIDTGLAVQMKQSAELIIQGLDSLLAALKAQINTHATTPCIGRSHGIHAEPTTFGLKLATHYAAFARMRQRMVLAMKDVSTCAISGAVGTFATIDPRVEAYVAAKLGLTVEPVSTQIIPRDRHAMYFSTLGVMAGAIENLAIEIRHLQRTELREAEESFAKGQKGSSAMPHKKNPISSENLTGIARLIRASVMPAMEDAVLWHERDISHSSVERIICPDANILVDYALHRLTGVIENLVVHKDRMDRNMKMTRGLVFSQAVMLALTEAGMKREDAYKIVQTHAMHVWENDDVLFLDLLLKDQAVMQVLDAGALTAIFDYDRYTRRAPEIIARVLKSAQ